MQNPNWKPSFTDGHEFTFGESLDDHAIYGKTGSVHLNFASLAWPEMPFKSELYLTRLIIHECSHKFANTHDFAYMWQNKKLLTPQSVNNADSIAYACISFHKGELFKDHTDIKQ
jgi:hypothetical protein